MPSLPAELKDLLLAPPPLTLAVAESLTCGRLQARICEVSGASSYFLGGIVAYSLEQKVRHLAVSRTDAERAKCVSAGIAEQMAVGACRMFGSDLGVATTGFAEPSAADRVTVPFAWWAVAQQREGRIVSRLSGRVEAPGAGRIDAQRLIADAVLAQLVDYLRAFRPAGKVEQFG